MPDGFWTFTVSMHLEKDSDLIECVKQYIKNTGCTRSELVRKALRLFFGLISTNNQENIDQAFIRVIQLEKQFNDLMTAFNQLRESIYKDIDSKLSEFMKMVEEFQKELEIIKEFHEKRKKEEEEEKRKKEEEERAKKIEAYREGVRKRLELTDMEQLQTDMEYAKAIVQSLKHWVLDELSARGFDAWEEFSWDELLEVIESDFPELKKVCEVVLNV
jgi:NADH dehydrogenase/NADH:ubiquinone oxidoreductase subunit G